jgi:hypothetical protein
MDTMQLPKREQEIHALLRSADPAALYVRSAAVDDALDVLCARLIEVGSADSPAKSPKRPRRAPGAVVAGGLAVLLLGGGVATAAQYTTHTGFFGWDGADHSEWLRPDAPDFLPTARELTKGIVFAPGDSAENYWWMFQQKNDDGTSTQFSTTGVKGNIADAASCSWQRTWMAAHEGGDSAGMAEASQHLHAAASSAAMRDNNNAAYTAHLIDAADRGDTGPMLTSLKMACPQPRPVAGQ